MDGVMTFEKCSRYNPENRDRAGEKHLERDVNHLTIVFNQVGRLADE
jgi:hypothetical protein